MGYATLLILLKLLYKYYIIKCILIGEKQVGKSLFKNRIIEEECAI